MSEFILLACPACTMNQPFFIALSLFVGTVPLAHFLFRRHAAAGMQWGIPRIDAWRLTSLLLMLLWIVPLAFAGSRKHSVLHTSCCTVGLATCFAYLWYRFCWLLDASYATGWKRSILFPGLVVPIIAVLGTFLGNWLLGMMLIAPVWPALVLPLTAMTAMVGIPLACIALLGIRLTFPQRPGALRGPAVPLQSTTMSPGRVLAEQSGQPEPPITPDLKS